MGAANKTPRLTKMLTAIIAAGEAGISPRDLTVEVYDEEDGGPLSAPACIHVMAHRLKKLGKITVEGHTWAAVYKSKGRGEPACAPLPN